MTSLNVDRILQMLEWIGNGEARQIRVRSGLSATQVASALEVTQPAVSRWEMGVRLPRGANARKYADLLHKLNGI